MDYMILDSWWAGIDILVNKENEIISYIVEEENTLIFHAHPQRVEEVWNFINSQKISTLREGVRIVVKEDYVEFVTLMNNQPML